MQPERHSLWLLLGVCTYPMYMNFMRSLRHYTTLRPWHVQIPWSPDPVIAPPSHLVILAFHTHIIIPMQASCQFLNPIAWNPRICLYWFSSTNPSIFSSSFYTSSLPWVYLQNLEGKPRNIWENIPCTVDPSPLQIWSNFHSKSSFEFNEVNWIQIHWTISSFKIQILALDFRISLV
jgi:hypothetical protein